MKTAATLAAVLLTLAACGSSDDSEETAAESTTTAAPAQTTAATPETTTTAEPAPSLPTASTIKPMPKDWSAAPAVWARIQELTDCDELQRQFDIADANRKADLDRAIQIMDAVDDRMRTVDCY